MHDDYLTIKESAESCRRSTKTVRRYIAVGLLPAYRVGPRSILVKRSDLDALMRRIPAA